MSEVSHYLKVTMRGGWLMGSDDQAHYFRTDTNERASLCGRYAKPLSKSTEPVDADPLARENCIDCRRELLTIKGLI